MDKSTPEIIYISTYPPRECGIATFTQDLVEIFDQLFGQVVRSKVVALDSGPGSVFEYPKKVILHFDSDSKEAYEQAADTINRMANVKLVNIQHEFGIFGGQWGRHLNGFLERLRLPVVINFHTVLPQPGEELRSEVANLARLAKALVVMTEGSKQILVEGYGVNPEQVWVIPHGIHALEYSLSETCKRKLDLQNRLVLTTFGLLGRGKGIEYVLEALPEVVEKFPTVLYLVLGKTHPEVVKQEGESYREFLQQKVVELGLSGHVQFIDRYLKLPELLDYLKATDVYMATSLDPNHTVSGTFSYALGTGRPVVSTSFAQARSELTPETGILVGIKDPVGYTQALCRLLGDQRLREEMGRKAYFQTRHETWQNVSLSYMKLFARLVPTLALSNIHLPPVKLSHLEALTDNFGVIQFAKLSLADPASGYTLDDNARALTVVGLYYARTSQQSVIKLVKTYLDFIAGALQPDGTFQNYFDQRHFLNAEANNKDDLEEANARALLALSRLAALPQISANIRQQANALYNSRMKAGVVFSFPRSIALFVKTLFFRWQQAEDKQSIKKEIILHCDKLLDFYQQNSSTDWQWFEKQLTYSNSILSEALLYGFQVTGDHRYFTVGKDTLDFLISHTFEHGMYMPIGQNGWYAKGQGRAYFDQQPEDTAAMVQTLKAMAEISGSAEYLKLMHRAFSWFLGDNVLGRFVYDCTSGGCYDGLGEKNVNLNQGAESTISYLLARLTLESSLIDPAQQPALDTQTLTADP